MNDSLRLQIPAVSRVVCTATAPRFETRLKPDKENFPCQLGR